MKYILSKLDFESFSLISPPSSCSTKEQIELINRIEHELNSYVNAFKQIPTVMRKVNPTSKSEAYRLFKLENFQFFEKERHQTDLFIGSLIID